MWPNPSIITINNTLTEVATKGVLWKNVLLKISQSSQENTCFYTKKCHALDQSKSVSIEDLPNTVAELELWLEL